MTAESDLAGFVDTFAPPMRSLIQDCRSAMRARFPDAVELVYDNYNFLVIGFGPTQRPSEAIFSLAAQRSGMSLFFVQRGQELPDPARLLHGSGKKVRSLRLETSSDLERPEVQALLDAAVGLASIPMTASEAHVLVIRSVSAKQRPRR